MASAGDVLVVGLHHLGSGGRLGDDGGVGQTAEAERRPVRMVEKRMLAAEKLG